MRILLLSRPVINGGDFLFTKRSLELFKKLLPLAEILTGHVSSNYELKFLNSFDKIIIAGGPMYDNRFLSHEAFPLLQNLRKIEAKIHFFANGWYGRDALAERVYSYKFNNEIKSDLKMIVDQGGIIGCRDYTTEQVLRNNGIGNTLMTGCSAWYDKDYIDCLSLKRPKAIGNIAISDQGMTKDAEYHDIKFEQTKKLIKFIKGRYPKSKIIYTFNGGIDTKFSGDFNRKICSFLTDKGIVYNDLSGNANNFVVYDSVDLHIGYRVHSHIYCLSHGIPSVLIEEDARGFGVNETLGLRGIRNFLYSADSFKNNGYIVEEVRDYLDDLDNEEFLRIECALNRIKYFYKNNVREFIDRL